MSQRIDAQRTRFGDVAAFKKRPDRNRSPIKLIMMKIRTKADRITSAETAADSKQNDEDLFVCQHNSKPHVVGSQSQVHPIKNAFTNKDDFWIEYNSKSLPVEKR